MLCADEKVGVKALIRRVAKGVITDFFEYHHVLGTLTFYDACYTRCVPAAAAHPVHFDRVTPKGCSRKSLGNRYLVSIRHHDKSPSMTGHLNGSDRPIVLGHFFEKVAPSTD